MAELIFAILILLTIIAFGFYWGFRPDEKEIKTNPNNPDVIYSKYTNSVKGFKDNAYTTVNL